MDKLTRLLWLYSKLLNGEEVNKWSFCLEADCQSRSFDRDIEDIRMFLSETYQAATLFYSRSENTYYLTAGQRQPLEMMEYQFIERVLVDTGLLRMDELQGMLFHLAQNAQNPHRARSQQQLIVGQYKEPFDCVPILKIHSDLQAIIDKQAVIKILYKSDVDELIAETVIPYAIKYDLGYLYLIAAATMSAALYPKYYRVDWINSFLIERTQTSMEKQRVSDYLKNDVGNITQMSGGDYCKITLHCQKKYYPYIYDIFRNARILSEDGDCTTVEVGAFEDGFIKWILSQPPEQIEVLQPQSILKKIYIKAQKILYKYEEVRNHGKENSFSIGDGK